MNNSVTYSSKLTCPGRKRNAFTQFQYTQRTTHYATWGAGDLPRGIPYSTLESRKNLDFCRLVNRWFSRYVIAAMLVDENKRFLISSFCSSTSNCTLQYCYLCPKRLVANHLYITNWIKKWVPSLIAMNYLSLKKQWRSLSPVWFSQGHHSELEQNIRQASFVIKRLKTQTLSINKERIEHETKTKRWKTHPRWKICLS